MAITSFRGEYSFLSNFYPSPITYDNLTYPTNENFFQAMKTTDKVYRRTFQMLTPDNAKRAGRKLRLRPDWDDKKKLVMLHGLREKFKSPQLAQQLLDTGDEELIEGNNWNDTYWGVCNGVGQNMLGKMLMLVREELKKEREQEDEQDDTEELHV